VLGKGNPSTIHLDSKKAPLRTAIEPKPGGDKVFVDNEHINAVVEVGDRTHIVDEHRDVLLASDGGIVVNQLSVDELVEVLEASLVERVDVVAVDPLQLSSHRPSQFIGYPNPTQEGRLCHTCSRQRA
jgi:hypothetical protein